VVYAASDDGIELPVVDITNPAFDVEVAPEEMAAFTEESLRSMEHWARTPAFVRKVVARRSVLMGGSSGSRTFLTGMATYLHKLGPANLDPSYTTAMDRKAAGMVQSVAVRMRLRSVARLIADALLAELVSRPDAPFHLVNIAGGPASDSLNALILVRNEHPGLLARPITIHVLDLEEAGPRFAARSLAALCANGAPLEGLAATVDHVAYDWSDVATLAGVLDRLGREDIVVGSSEGGLFEYGSAADVAANLRVLARGTPGGFRMVATTWRDNRFTRVAQKTSSLRFVLRDGEDLRRLVAEVDWAIDRSIDDNPVYHIVSLRKLAAT